MYQTRAQLLEKNKRITKRCNNLENKVDNLENSNQTLKKVNKQLKVENAEYHELKKELGYSFKDSKAMGARQKSMLRHKVLNNFIDDSAFLKSYTGLSHGKFEYLYRIFIKKVKRDPNAPQLLGLKVTQGNVCKLLPRHILLLILMRHYTGMSQKLLAQMFMVNQSTISRRLDYGLKILSRIVPSSKKVKNVLKYGSEDIRRTILTGPNGGTVIIDGSRVPAFRPSDAKQQKKMYSGKTKNFCINTIVIVNKDGLVLYVSKSYPGATHDKTITDRSLRDLEEIFPSLFDPNTSSEQKIKILADLGFLGIAQNFEGGNVEIPEKKSKYHKLTDKQKARNRKRAKRRVKVEHVFGRAKVNQILQRAFKRNIKKFSLEFKCIMGITNLHTLWNNKRDKPKPLLEKLIGT